MQLKELISEICGTIIIIKSILIKYSKNKLIIKLIYKYEFNLNNMTNKNAKSEAHNCIRSAVIF